MLLQLLNYTWFKHLENYEVPVIFTRLSLRLKDASSLVSLAGDTRDLVAESKQTMSANVLCQGLPVQLRTFLEYSRSLSFTDKPNYNYLRNLFDASLSREGSGDDLVFDWDSSDI